MSLEQIKEKLKIKPVAETKQQVLINIPITNVFNEDVNISSDNEVKQQVQEKIGSMSVDRDSIMRRLKEYGIMKVMRQDEKIKIAQDLEDNEDTEQSFISPEKTKSKKITLEEITRLEADDDIEDITQRKERKTPKPIKGVAEIPVEEWVNVNGDKVIDKIPPRLPTTTMRMSGYYMNNRKKFINFINSYFGEYRDEILNEKLALSCDDMGSNTGEFKLLIHQKIVKDYLNLYTPYRGLLLYHGLGSGKTCSSIAIAEGIQTSKKVIIMTPKSLRRNYIEEIKKCGDSIFKKDQFWEWVPLKENKEALDTLSNALGLTTDFISKKKGVWLVDHNKPSNHDSLNSKQLMSLDIQLDEMIQTKYEFINYNGLRRDKLRAKTSNYQNNIFDHSVVVIDEVHNFISRISNKLRKEKLSSRDKDGEIDKFPISTALVLYEMLMSAQDTRIVFLTGTPIINYPNELGILYNILRGYIKTWNFTLQNASAKQINDIFAHDKYMDNFEYSRGNILSVTRNPFGFEKRFEKGLYKGVTGNPKKDKVTNEDGEENIVMNERGQISDADFKNRIIKILESNNITVNKHKTNVDMFKALPDTFEEFESTFLGENNTIKNAELFKKRILGLSSYFRSAQEELLPRYDPLTDFNVIKIPMSDYQLAGYEEARNAERREDSKKRTKKPSLDKDGLFEQPSSSYRIFSRLYCNFVMPLPPGRPLPRENNISESYTKAIGESNKKGSNDMDEKDTDNIEGDEMIEKNADTDYKTRISNAMNFLKENGRNIFSPEGLETYSPKFLRMLENIADKDHQGLHLVYSQFRTLEGIGIFKLVLDHNGYTQFKVKKGSDGVWDIDIDEHNLGKPTYALYTGTESDEEKELIRNIYNSDWDSNLPITKKLQEIANNNHMGAIIKILMITASGSEGINLRSTRFVHIMEPYWHPTRKDQVIGRARRICSHKSLPEDMQDVRVFLYLMTISDEQLNETATKDLKLHDRSKLKYKISADSNKMETRVVTSDEALYEISTMKEKITMGLTKLIKESAIDCATYSKRGNKENLECVQFGTPRANEMTYIPDIKKQPSDIAEKNNEQLETVKMTQITINGNVYARKQVSDTVGYLYDLESYYQSLENPGIEPNLVAVEELINGKWIRRQP